MIFSSCMSSLRSSPSACRTSRRAALKHSTRIVALRRRCIGDRVGARLSKPSSRRDIAAPLAKHPSASSRARRQGYGRDSRKRKCSREDRVKNRTPPYTLNEREHLRLVTRLRIWGRSSESFAREWDRGGRFDGLPELAIPGRGHADFSLEGFAKGHF